MVEYVKYRNERAVFLAIKRGTYPKLPDNLVPRTLTIEKLKEIFCKPHDYHLIVGEHGTGKTTVVIQTATEFGGGIVYIQGSDKLDKFSDAFVKALGWSYAVDRISGLLKILGVQDTNGKGYRIWTLLKRQSLYSLISFKLLPLIDIKDPMYILDRVIEAFRRSAAKYKAKYHKPAVLVLDDISGLAKEHPDVIKHLQNIAKDVADKKEFAFVFVASEETIPTLMSRACRLLSVILFMFLPRLC